MVLTIVVFLSVTLSVAGVYLVLTGYFHPDASRVRRRMAEEFGQGSRSQASPSTLFKNLEQLTLDAAQVPPDPSRPEGGDARDARRPGWRERLDKVLMQANLPLTVNQLLMLVGAFGFALGLPGAWFGGVFGGLATTVVGAAAPLLFVHLRRKARREKYLRQLPGAFELMARVIRAGQSVPQALKAVAESFEDPLAGDFANCEEQQNLGLRPEVCFQEMAERSGIVEMRIFAMAMLIQRQSGGNLSDVLERMAGLLRARLRLRQHVRTLTAEGRLQGWTLVVLPFVVFGAMMVINRAYAETLFDHVPLVVAMFGAMGAGMLWIRKIVNFEC